MRILTILMTATLVASQPALAEDTHHNHAKPSPYAGQQTRDIKAFSREDVEELLRGGGWGLAKAAELNGMPGPTHVLDMAGELDLGVDQRTKIAVIRDDMRREAQALGSLFVEKEGELERLFHSGEMSESKLAAAVEQIEGVRARLRTAHLAAHVRVANILTAEQTDRYAVLRGYR